MSLSLIILLGVLAPVVLGLLWQQITRRMEKDE